VDVPQAAHSINTTGIINFVFKTFTSLSSSKKIISGYARGVKHGLSMGFEALAGLMFPG
jgi:hypothetical protein